MNTPGKPLPKNIPTGITLLGAITSMKARGLLAKPGQVTYTHKNGEEPPKINTLRARGINRVWSQTQGKVRKIAPIAA